MKRIYRDLLDDFICKNKKQKTSTCLCSLCKKVIPNVGFVETIP